MSAAVAARTTNVLITIAAVIVPFYDPLRLAEDLAVIDNISRGRLMVIFAAGYAPHEFEMFGVDPKDRPRLVEEAFDTMRKAWTGEPFEYQGRQARVTPAPFQEGGPKLVMGGTSAAAARRAARIADGFIPAGSEWGQAYIDECERLGRDPGLFTSSDPVTIMLSEDPERSWEQLAPYFFHETNAYGAWRVASGESSPFDPRSDLDDLKTCGLYKILTPDEFAAEQEGETGVYGMHPMVGGVPPELAWENLRLFEKHFL
jgi:alkanesulfonate monooxygenase SsuD/methylene tetrahydromethanopterin reductase-like flavin-dependent oxidoreductase (luciferase family)